MYDGLDVMEQSSNKHVIDAGMDLTAFNAMAKLNLKQNSVGRPNKTKDVVNAGDVLSQARRFHHVSMSGMDYGLPKSLHREVEHPQLNGFSQYVLDDEQLEDEIQTELSTLLTRVKSYKSLHDGDEECMEHVLQDEEEENSGTAQFLNRLAQSINSIKEGAPPSMQRGPGLPWLNRHRGSGGIPEGASRHSAPDMAVVVEPPAGGVNPCSRTATARTASRPRAAHTPRDRSPSRRASFHSHLSALTIPSNDSLSELLHQITTPSAPSPSLPSLSNFHSSKNYCSSGSAYASTYGSGASTPTARISCSTPFGSRAQLPSVHADLLTSSSDRVTPLCISSQPGFPTHTHAPPPSTTPPPPALTPAFTCPPLRHNPAPPTALTPMPPTARHPARARQSQRSTSYSNLGDLADGASCPSSRPLGRPPGGNLSPLAPPLASFMGRRSMGY